MYPDSLYAFIGIKGTGWILIAAAYVVFDYLLNALMCFLTGGVQKVRELYPMQMKKGTKTLHISRGLLKEFAAGGTEKITEFRTDQLSWLWPITILAIPLALVGITREVKGSAINSLNSIGVSFENYRLLPITYMQ